MVSPVCFLHLICLEKMKWNSAERGSLRSAGFHTLPLDQDQVIPHPRRAKGSVAPSHGMIRLAAKGATQVFDARRKAGGFWFYYMFMLPRYSFGVRRARGAEPHTFAFAHRGVPVRTSLARVASEKRNAAIANACPDGVCCTIALAEAPAVVRVCSGRSAM